MCQRSYSMAAAPFLLPGALTRAQAGSNPRNVQKSSLACQQQCQHLNSCKYGVYITSGYRKGECWLSANKAHKPHPCGVPCQSFANSALKAKCGVGIPTPALRFSGLATSDGGGQ
jgi:hypothetical protein